MPDKEEIENVLEVAGTIIRPAYAPTLTLDEFINHLKIDTGIWEVARFDVKTWDTAYKDNDGEPNFMRNFGMNAKLVRKVLEPRIPIPQPIRAVTHKVQFNKKRAKLRSGVKTCLVIPDIQVGYEFRMNGRFETVPFHDRLALDAILQMSIDLKPDVIVQIGDLLDLAEHSRFTGKQEFHNTTQTQLLEAHWWMAQFRKFNPQAEMYVIEGNHDARFEKHMKDHAMQSYGLKAADEIHIKQEPMQRYLALDKLKINYAGDYPNGRVWLNPEIALMHGDLVGQSGGTCSKYLNKYSYSTASGHTHRLEGAWKTSYKDNHKHEHFHIDVGCVCNPEVTPSRKKELDWQKGCAIIEFKDDASYKNFHLIKIEEGGRLFWNGAQYSGLPRIEDLKRDFDWELF